MSAFTAFSSYAIQYYMNSFYSQQKNTRDFRIMVTAGTALTGFTIDEFNVISIIVLSQQMCPVLDVTLAAVSLADRHLGVEGGNIRGAIFTLCTCFLMIFRNTVATVYFDQRNVTCSALLSRRIKRPIWWADYSDTAKIRKPRKSSKHFLIWQNQGKQISLLAACLTSICNCFLRQLAR
ncbi:Hypothetical predicted protein [Cloeon dipterum]|uniref:Uncharacterized protein n=1 Tax=Cloeon dipterum TaxID=197152 RepID=A0A8S1DNR0_9INSE|nr:Hypothetical predicted protein [Cloeon dipterum]